MAEGQEEKIGYNTVMTKLVIFDLDNTLSESRSKIAPSMAILLDQLLKQKEVAIISGGTFTQIDFQVLAQLPPNTFLNNLTLLPESGASYLQNKNGLWEKIYAIDLTKKEGKLIYDSINKVFAIEKPVVFFKPLIEDKGGEITYSPVGINAPKEIKEAFDPDHHKRKKIVTALKNLLPDFEINIGGLSSIDITKKGMNKSFGVNKLLALKNLKPAEVIFIGDSLFQSGNDAAVRSSGVKCIQVKEPKETEEIITKILVEQYHPMAFFCMEYAVDDDPDTYAGGLGILAGDYLLESADKDFPIMAFGLHYGYDISPDFSVLVDNKNNPVLVDIPIAKEIIKAKVWQRHFKASVRLMIFDTNIPENSEANRSLTSRLYDSHFYTRLKQQMILGIGGVRLLKILRIKPQAYHLNEGHTAFTALAVYAED
ncbi:MAG: HAD-IIB family hydrolase, partial [Patescibacteria group bacterium]